MWVRIALLGLFLSSRRMSRSCLTLLYLQTWLLRLGLLLEGDQQGWSVMSVRDGASVEEAVAGWASEVEARRSGLKEGI